MENGYRNLDGRLVHSFADFTNDFAASNRAAHVDRDRDRYVAGCHRADVGGDAVVDEASAPMVGQTNRRAITERNEP